MQRNYTGENLKWSCTVEESKPEKRGTSLQRQTPEVLMREKEIREREREREEQELRTKILLCIHE